MRLLPGRGGFASMTGGGLPAALRQVGEVVARGGDGRLLVLGQQIAAAGDLAVHAGAAHLFERHLLADHHLRHPRRAEVHGGVLLHHEDDVAEGGDVGAAGGRGAEEQADLRDGPGKLHLVAEDAAGMAAPREHVQLVGDAGPRRIDQVEERQPHPPGGLLHANHLLHGAGAPRPRLHRRIVGNDGHRPTVHAADPGDDTVGRQIARGGVGEETILGEVLAPVVDRAARSARGRTACRRQRCSRGTSRPRLCGPCPPENRALRFVTSMFPYRPLKMGARFSAKAAKASLRSSLVSTSS